MKRILVTGGAGFIGNHLCRALLNEGHYVVCMDNFLTGSEKNINDMLPDKKFKLIEHDVQIPYDISVDEIYNLACPASPIWYQTDPVRTVKTSVLGIINALEVAKAYNARILQSSTSEIYGNALEHPQKETYNGNVNPIGLRSCYDEGKRCAETLLTDYHRQYNINTRLIRIFNTYGPNMAQNDGRVIPNFIIQALKNEDITIFGQGNQTRSFCYVSDLISGMIKMMNNNQNFHGPVNLGNPEEKTILNIAQTIVRLTDSKSKTIFTSLPSDDPIQRKPDISLAKEKLDWQPQVSLEKGLIKTIDYFKQQLLYNPSIEPLRMNKGPSL